MQQTQFMSVHLNMELWGELIKQLLNSRSS